MKNKAMQQTENKQNILFKRKQNNEKENMKKVRRHKVYNKKVQNT